MITPERDLYVISNVQGGHGLVAKVPSNSWDSDDMVPLSSTSHFAMDSTYADPASKPSWWIVLVYCYFHCFDTVNVLIGVTAVLDSVVVYEEL